jgi:hypothetical protein
VDSLRDAVRDTEIEIRGFREEAEPIACHAPDLAARTAPQAAKIERTGAAMTGIADALGQAERGREIVTESIGAMSLIEASFGAIQDIANMIASTAAQTDLLAPSATVEAGRGRSEQKRSEQRWCRQRRRRHGAGGGPARAKRKRRGKRDSHADRQQLGPSGGWRAAGRSHRRDAGGVARR